VPHTVEVATALIVVALLAGGLGALRWRHRSGPAGPVASDPADATTKPVLPANPRSIAVVEPTVSGEPTLPAETTAAGEPAGSVKPAAAGAETGRRSAKAKRPGKKPAAPVISADQLLAGSADVDDLDAVFDRVLESHSRELGILLGSRLQRLVDRRVPVRAIREAPGTSAARVCFADGTIVLARGVEPGDFVRIAWGIHASSVWLQGFSRVDATTRLDLRWHEGRVAVVALGLDQPD